MHLYALTLTKPGSINQAIYGNFSSSKAQELLISRGRILELWRKGKLRLLLSCEVFGLIRSISPFRLTGTNKDYIIMGSDSGRIVILQYNPQKNSFDKVHQETYGKTGIRRIVPGQYISPDPKGRALMISAIEKQKFVYILNRNTENMLTISSPLEAHKSHNIIFGTAGVDVGYDNPLFAVIESDYGDWDEPDAPVKTGNVVKNLTFYEMDLGLNHVVRKSTERIDITASSIHTVPGGKDGPGGVLVFCEDSLYYKSYPSGVTIQCRYPIRLGNDSETGLLMNCVTMHKQKGLFFYMAQNEYGDIYKISIKFTGKEVHNIQMQYLDTVPRAISLCILKTGFLFVAAESGNHHLYCLQHLGETDHFKVVSSSADDEKMPVPVFFPRKLINLKLVDEWQSLTTIADMKTQDVVGEGNPQIYTLCAAGQRSSLRILRHGLPVTEVAVSDLPNKPSAIWTVKESNDSEFDKYIILSFQSATFVLLIGERVVEVENSNFETSKATILVSLMIDDSIIQVYSTGVRHIKPNGNISEWQSESGKITYATANKKQLAISVQGGEIIYFEIDSEGNLSEEEKIRVESEIISMHVGDIPEERQRSKFLAVGFSDNTVKLYSLDIESCLLRLSSQALPNSPHSVCLIEYSDPNYSYITDEEVSPDNLFLHIGLSNGALFRTSVDKITGSLTETRTRFLGSKPTKLFKVTVNGRPALVALSSRPWIGYLERTNYMITPLLYKPFDCLSTFQAKICPDGLVGIVGKALKIFKVENLGDLFSQTVVPLKYIPRKMAINGDSQTMFIMESAHRTYSDEKNSKIIKELISKHDKLAPPEKNKFRVVAPKGTWASCIRIFDPVKLKTTDLHEFRNNETAISISLTKFDKYKADTFLLVGTVKDFIMVPKSYSNCYVHTFILDEDDKKMQILHTTTMDGIPFSIAPHKGMVLCGIGYMLRMYDIGKLQLLKKCEYKHLYMGVNNIFTFGERIFISDLSDSFHLLKHKQRENQFVEIADDILPRWITAAAILDYHTVIGADKFENIFVCRLPESVDDEINEDFYTYKFKWEAGYLNGAACKFEQICNYFFGEVVTSLQKVALTSTSSDSIVFGTSNGSIAVMLPFETKEDLDFFVHLEMYMKMENKPLAGRDHMAYRSYHGAVKNVIDGDLIEQFTALEREKQEMLAEELDRTPIEVVKKLEDVRNRIV